MTADPLTAARRHSWADLARWRCDGEPWERYVDPEPAAFVTLICRCGATSTEHNPDLKGSPRVDVLTGARLCPAFDPVARIRQVTYIELQTARVDRVDDTPP